MTGPHLTPEEIADGLALWEEHKPQSGEDWVEVARRFVDADGDVSKSSPLFTAVVLLTRALDAERAAHAQTRAALKASTELLITVSRLGVRYAAHSLDAQVQANQVALGLATPEADEA